MSIDSSPSAGLSLAQEQMLQRLGGCLPIPLPMQCYMNYSLGVSRRQEYIPMDPLLAPFNMPERMQGRITDTRA